MTKPLRLMLVSYPRRLDVVFERSVLLLARHVGPAFRLERCQSPAQVPWLARQWRRRGHRIDCMELLGHGRPGAFALGDELLLTADGDGLELVRALGEELAEDARVHLLGCRLAQRDARWLAPFQRALGARRTLWAAASWVSHVAFLKGPLDEAAQARLVRAPTRRSSTPESRHPHRPGGNAAGRGTHGQQEEEEADGEEEGHQQQAREEEGGRASRRRQASGARRP